MSDEREFVALSCGCQVRGGPVMACPACGRLEAIPDRAAIESHVAEKIAAAIDNQAADLERHAVIALTARMAEARDYADKAKVKREDAAFIRSGGWKQ